MTRPRPVMLMILDGWGYREAHEGNAICYADKTTWDGLWLTYPHAFLTTCGEAVGLPKGTMGNSEVGHLNIGAGRIVYQDLTRINHSIDDGSFFRNEVLLSTCKKIAASGHALHLLGLCSDVGVHAHLDHLDALLDLAKQEGVQKVFIHAITDGRDSPPTSGREYLKRVERKAKEVGNAHVATVSGRFYAMDRDKRWERTERAWKAIALGEGESAASSTEAIEHSYAHNVTDEFLVPTVMREKGKPVATLHDGDAIIFFNSRADRTRELTRALAFKDFDSFARPRMPKLSEFVCMTEYDATFHLPIAFPSEELKNIFGSVVSQAGLKQLRIAETEKYAHVTFFLNGMVEQEFSGEDRVIIPSPRVSTYNKTPEMSAMLIAERVVKEIISNIYDVLIVNFANPDMVGHTGDEAATVKANETTDEAMGMIVDAALTLGGACLVTADHGNAEEVKNLVTGEIDKEHSTNAVPFIVIGKQFEGMRAPAGDVVGGDLSLTTPVGMLGDVAPTLLKILEIPQPPEMTGRALI